MQQGPACRCSRKRRGRAAGTAEQQCQKLVDNCGSCQTIDCYAKLSAPLSSTVYALGVHKAGQRLRGESSNGRASSPLGSRKPPDANKPSPHQTLTGVPGGRMKGGGGAGLGGGGARNSSTAPCFSGTVGAGGGG